MWKAPGSQSCVAKVRCVRLNMEMRKQSATENKVSPHWSSAKLLGRAPAMERARSSSRWSFMHDSCVSPVVRSRAKFSGLHLTVSGPRGFSATTNRSLSLSRETTIALHPLRSFLDLRPQIVCVCVRMHASGGDPHDSADRDGGDRITLASNFCTGARLYGKYCCKWVLP